MTENKSIAERNIRICHYITKKFLFITVTRAMWYVPLMDVLRIKNRSLFYTPRIPVANASIPPAIRLVSGDRFRVKPHEEEKLHSEIIV